MDEQKKREIEGLVWQAWFDRIALGAVAVLMYQALVVSGNSTSLTWLEDVLPKWHWPNSTFDSVFIGFFGLFALILLLRSLGVGLKWPHSDNCQSPVPTLQVSVAWAMLLLLAGAWWQGDISRASVFGCTLLVYIFICGISDFVLDWLRPQPVGDTVTPAKILENLTDKKFENWLGDDAATDRYDFFDRTPLIDRMYNRLISPQTPGQRGQILFGDYGSGKSTVIKLLQQKLKEEQWLVVRFDTWGRSEAPADITTMILDSILEEIRSSGVETVSLLDASNRYIQAAFQIESRLSVLGILSAKQSPEDILKEVNRILFLNNLRMLVIIEDTDRCHDADKVIDTIAGLLDRISHLSAFRFILTLKREAVKNDTALKLADFMEDIYSNANSKLLKRFFKLCIAKDRFVSPELRYYGLDVWPLIDSDNNNINRNIDDIISYLGNIRTTRFIFKATLDCWEQVKEGAYFTDVFITQIIRHDKRLEGDLAVLENTDKRLPPTFLLKSSNSGVDYERKIRLMLEKDKSSQSDKNINKLIQELFGVPVTLSIQENRETGSLLKKLSHQPANRSSPFRGLIQRMAPDYWTDILNSRLSESNRIKEFFDALDLVSKNPDESEQPVILDMMYCHPDLAPFAVGADGSGQFMKWGNSRFLAGLIIHFVRKNYRKADAGDSARDFKEKTVLYLVDAMYENFRFSGSDSSDLESAVAAIEEIKKYISDDDILIYVAIIKSGIPNLLSHAERESEGKDVFDIIIEKLRNPAKQDIDQ